MALRMRASTWQRLKLPLLIIGLALWIAWNNGFVSFPSWSSPDKPSQTRTQTTDEKSRKERDIEGAILKQVRAPFPYIFSEFYVGRPGSSRGM